MYYTKKNNTFVLSALTIALISVSYTSHSATFIVNGGQQVAIDEPFISIGDNLASTAGDAVRVTANSKLTLNNSANITSSGDSSRGLSVSASSVTLNGETQITTNGNSDLTHQ